VALCAILALPLRAMAALFCGRGGSKPSARSNKSKDCKLQKAPALAGAESVSRATVCGLILCSWPRWRAPA